MQIFIKSFGLFLFSVLKTEKRKREKVCQKKKRTAEPARVSPASRPRTSPAPSRIPAPLLPLFLFSLPRVRVEHDEPNQSRENLHRIGVIRCPSPLYLFSTISASSPPQNPSFYAARLLDFELEPPQPAAGNLLAPVHLRRPLPPSFPPLASSLHGTPHGHPCSFFCAPDRRARDRPKPPAATRYSGEQSPEQEESLDRYPSPTTSPRRPERIGTLHEP